MNAIQKIHVWLMSPAKHQSSAPSWSFVFLSVALYHLIISKYYPGAVACIVLYLLNKFFIKAV